VKVLDICCCGGGSASGLKEAYPDAEIIGIDIIPQPDYPFKFIQMDVKDLTVEFINGFDFAWASVPCQRYSRGGNPESRKRYPDLVASVRDILIKSGIPFVMENVPQAPLRKDLFLCGEMFGLKVIRHRIFEIHGFVCKQPPIRCKEHKGKVVNGEYIMVCRGGRPGCYGDKEKRNRLKAPTLGQAKEAMGIEHITNFNTIAEAIPPAYAKYIMRQFVKQKEVKSGCDANDDGIPLNNKLLGILPNEL
jgi:DNA (cytosine-5)-methyltransferase 1